MNVVQINKRINIARVLKAVWLNKGISRIEIAHMLGLDKSTITNIVSELQGLGIIKTQAKGQASSQGGRKPIELMIDKNFVYMAGVEFQPESYNVIIVNLDGEIIYSKKQHIIINKENLVDVFLNMYSKIKQVAKEYKLKILAIGVGLGGIINPEKGIIYQSIPLNVVHEFNLIENIKNKIDIPVYIENDANCCCWGEILTHKKEHLQNFIFILSEFREVSAPTFEYPGIAVGLGIVINGEVYYGQDYSTGEFRSAYWHHPNRSQFSLTDDDVINIAQNDQIFLKFFKELAMNIALFVNTFNLCHIFLGGDIEKKKIFHLESILTESIQNNWAYSNKVNCEIKFSSFGENAVAYGAACMLLEKLFTVPKVPFGSIKSLKGNKDLLQILRKSKLTATL